MLKSTLHHPEKIRSLAGHMSKNPWNRHISWDTEIPRTEEVVGEGRVEKRPNQIASYRRERVRSRIKRDKSRVRKHEKDHPEPQKYVPPGCLTCVGDACEKLCGWRLGMGGKRKTHKKSRKKSRRKTHKKSRGRKSSGKTHKKSRGRKSRGRKSRGKTKKGGYNSHCALAAEKKQGYTKVEGDAYCLDFYAKTGKTKCNMYNGECMAPPVRTRQSRGG